MKKAAKAKAANTEAATDGPGKGRKRCTNCGQHSGTRAKRCQHCMESFG